MTDRELLERCAKVMRNGAQWDCPERGMMVLTPDGIDTMTWNPLTNLADAAEMSIKCKVDVFWSDREEKVCVISQGFEHTAYFKNHPTEQAAYCYAICQVVVHMGGE